jgi:hypothetical protein
VIDETLAAHGATDASACFLLTTSFAHRWPEDNQPAPNRIWAGQIFAKSREDKSDDTWQKGILSARYVPLPLRVHSICLQHRATMVGTVRGY